MSLTRAVKSTVRAVFAAMVTCGETRRQSLLGDQPPLVRTSAERPEGTASEALDTRTMTGAFAGSNS